MRRARVRGYQEELQDLTVYHCMSRVINREFLLDKDAKNVFRKQLWQVAAFSGVRILTYCLMDNHFHILVGIPGRQKVVVSDAELVRRFCLLYHGDTGQNFTDVEGLHGQSRLSSDGVLTFNKHQSDLAGYSPESLARILSRGDKEAEKVRRRLLARMHNVSEFMKTLKLRFTLWFNRRHERLGTLWTERFKSVLIEGTVKAAGTVAAYIDLNPVRAGLVKDPKDYPWCGYAEAAKGKSEAIEGIKLIAEMTQEEPSKKVQSDKKHEGEYPENTEAMAYYGDTLEVKARWLRPPADESQGDSKANSAVWHPFYCQKQSGLSRAKVVGSSSFVTRFLIHRHQIGELCRLRSPKPIFARNNNPPLALARESAGKTDLVEEPCHVTSDLGACSVRRSV